MTINPLLPAVCALILLAVHVSTAVAQPATLYKPQHIAHARENVERYPWARNLLAWYVSGSAFVLEQDREALRALVPDLTPWSPYGQVCPACVGEGCSMGETYVLQWDVSNPDILRCRYCGTEYPQPDYPETGVLECPQMGQTFTYYINDEQRAHPEEDPGKHAYRWAGRPVQVSFTGVIRERKLNWALAQPLNLAKAYVLTDDVRYAERAAWLLERLAEVFPNYLYHSYGGAFADCDPAEATREMGQNPPAGRFPEGVIRHPAEEMRRNNRLDAGFWGSGRFIPSVCGEGGALFNMTVAYDLTRDAVYADGTPVYTPQMHERIINDLILAGAGDLENYDAINNKAGPGRALSGAVGILFGPPERIRRALEGFEQILENCFHFDGFCKESPAYSSMHLGLMQNIPELLTGYSDPAGYTDAEGRRFDDFDPFVHTPRYRLALESMVSMLRPDLRFPVIGNTHAGGTTSPHYVEILAANYGQRYAGLLEALQGAPLDQRGSEYALWRRDPELTAPEQEPDAGLRTEHFPGWKVGVLRSGNDDSQTAFYFVGYQMHGHRHLDTLGIIYHAFNKELASDRGYIWDDPRNAWTTSTLAHNIVAVDGDSQIRNWERTSALEVFSVSPGVEVIQASSNAYAQCSEYRRTCALIRLPEGGNYVADIFRVAGGALHQYAFNSNGDFLGLEGVETAPVEGKISWLDNLRVAAPGPDHWHATWLHEGVHMRLHMTGALDRLVVADAPGWRTFRGDQLHAPPITQLVAERTAEEDLRSVYTAVMSPYREGEQAPVQGLRRLEAEPAADTAVALAVEVNGRTDYIISALDDTPRTYGPVRMAGRFAYVSVDAGGNVLRAYLLDGVELSCGDVHLGLDTPRTVRTVVGVEGSVVELDEPLPHAAALEGAYLLTDGTGFEVESAEGTRLTVRNYPFVGGEQVVIPHSAWFER